MPNSFSNAVVVASAFSPSLVNQPLSVVAVTYLSGNNVPFQTVPVYFSTVGPTTQGFAFNAKSITVPLSAAASVDVRTNILSFPVEGTTVIVPVALSGTDMALILKPVNNIQRYVIISFVANPSNGGSVTPLLSTITVDALGGNARRLYNLGYV